MTEDSSSGAHRSKRRSSSRRVSTQRERNDDDDYDYPHHRSRNDGRASSEPSHDTHHHSSSSGRHRHSHQDDGSSKRSSKSKQTPIATATPTQKAGSKKGYDDDSTVSSIQNGRPDLKWHQKTWVRVFLGFLVILITVIITFFVLTATGLSQKAASSNASVDASNAPSAVASNSPSNAPTPVPFFKYAPPDDEACDKKSFETGDTSFVEGGNTREFEFTFDLTLSFADSSGEWVKELVGKVNTALIPILVGCPDDDNDRRLWSEEIKELSDNTNRLRGGSLSDQDAQLDALERLQNSPNRLLRRLVDSNEIKFRYVIDDATVVGSSTSKIECPKEVDQVTPQQDPRQGLPAICYRVNVYVDLLLRGEERVFSLVQLMTTILTELSGSASEPSEDEAANSVSRPKSLLESMELTIPFQKISVVGVTNRDPTNSPSTSPSRSPTNRPSAIPTNRPSISPTLFPTNRPSVAPSYNPTDRPTPGPTRRPTPGPTPLPTKSPTPPPTANPSRSFAPTTKPTMLPTCADFWLPQDTDASVIDPNDPPDTLCESADENN